MKNQMLQRIEFPLDVQAILHYLDERDFKADEYIVVPGINSPSGHWCIVFLDQFLSLERVIKLLPECQVNMVRTESSQRGNLGKHILAQIPLQGDEDDPIM